MTNPNMPILYQNIMFGLNSDIGRQAFLWATERPQNDRLCYAAERYAHEIEQLLGVFTFLNETANFHRFKRGGLVASEAQIDDLTNFMLTRHANWRWGGNAKPNFLTVAI